MGENRAFYGGSDGFQRLRTAFFRDPRFRPRGKFSSLTDNDSVESSGLALGKATADGAACPGDVGGDPFPTGG